MVSFEFLRRVAFVGALSLASVICQGAPVMCPEPDALKFNYRHMRYEAPLTKGMPVSWGKMVSGKASEQHKRIRFNGLKISSVLRQHKLTCLYYRDLDPGTVSLALEPEFSDIPKVRKSYYQASSNVDESINFDLLPEPVIKGEIQSNSCEENEYADDNRSYSCGGCESSVGCVFHIPQFQVDFQPGTSYHWTVKVAGLKGKSDDSSISRTITQKATGFIDYNPVYEGIKTMVTGSANTSLYIDSPLVNPSLVEFIDYDEPCYPGNYQNGLCDWWGGISRQFKCSKENLSRIKADEYVVFSLRANMNGVEADQYHCLFHRVPMSDGRPQETLLQSYLEWFYTAMKRREKG